QSVDLFFWSTRTQISFRHFHSEHISWAKHVRAKDNPLPIACEGHVWLETVVVFGEIHELLSPETFSIRPEQINPLTIARRRNAIWPTTIAGEKLTVRRYVEVH